MPRSARRISESGYMHVIVRGIGKQLLFEDANDFKFYLKRLERYCLETDVKICAYCLMENHVHLLVHGKSVSIALLMKKIGVSYSWYFNNKYDRVGHLFQDRYTSEPIENERYLLAVFRYILQNPQKAGICRTADYPWSSYRLYDGSLAYMDLSIFHELVGNRTQFEKFMASDSEEECLEIENTKHDDEWAKRVIKRCLGIESGTMLQNYSKTDRNNAIRELKAHGLSVRQIERLTGLGRSIVQRVG